MANRVTPYEPTDWQNLPTKTTPLNKTNLDHIEQGIKTVTDGLNNLPSYELPTASSSTKGGIKVGNTLSISNAVLNYNLPTAGANTKGGVKIGNTLSIQNDTLNYNLPIASSSVLGGIKVGANLSIDNDGVLNAADAPEQSISISDDKLFKFEPICYSENYYSQTGDGWTVSIENNTITINQDNTVLEGHWVSFTWFYVKFSTWNDIAIGNYMSAFPLGRFRIKYQDTIGVTYDVTTGKIISLDEHFNPQSITNDWTYEIYLPAGQIVNEEITPKLAKYVPPIEIGSDGYISLD